MKEQGAEMKLALTGGKTFFGRLRNLPYFLSGLKKMKEELRRFTESEDEKLERKLKLWHSSHMGKVSLEGSNARPNGGYVYYNGRPVCDDDHNGSDSWDLNNATVVCKMLGFSNVTEHYSDICNFGPCPPNGTPFSMSGLKCTGNEIHIEDCVHDSTVSSYCGRRRFTQNTGDIVGVECV